jgi:hypothetical protein
MPAFAARAVGQGSAKVHPSFGTGTARLRALPYPYIVMVKIVLVVLAGIVALNVALLLGAVVVAVLDRRRRLRDIRELEVLWGLEPRRPVPAGTTLTARRRSPVMALPARAIAGRKLVGVTLVAAVAFAGTASASPHARQMVASVFTTVSRGLGFRAQVSTERAADTTPSIAGARSAAAAVREAPSAAVRPHDAPGGGSSGATAPAGAGGSTITDPGAVPVGATTVTASAVSSTEVDVRWSDVAGESGYRVERSPDGAAGWSAVADLDRNVTAQLDTGLVAGSTYFYRVVTVTDGGDASVSDVASVTTMIDPADPPTVVNAVAVSSSQVDLNWSDVATETGYRIERSLDGTSDWITIGTTGQDVTDYSDAGLMSGTAYAYRVIATNDAGDSVPSEVVTVTTGTDVATTPSDPPAVPAG